MQNHTINKDEYLHTMTKKSGVTHIDCKIPKLTTALLMLPLALSSAFGDSISADNIEQLNQQRNQYNSYQESLKDAIIPSLSSQKTNEISQDSQENQASQQAERQQVEGEERTEEQIQRQVDGQSQDTLQYSQKSNPTCFWVDYIALASPFPKQKVQKEFGFLQPIFDFYSHKCLEPSDIATLLNALKHKAIKKGYITTSFGLKPQNLSTKRLLITLQTSTISDILIDNPKYARLLRKDYGIKIGDFLNITAIERGLYSYKRLRSVSSRIHLESHLQSNQQPNSQSSLEPNTKSNPQTPQSTQAAQSSKDTTQALQIPQIKIHLHHQAKTLGKIYAPFYGAISIDNAGSRATNIYQTSLQFGLENLAGLAEKLSAYFVSTPLWDKQKSSIYTSLDFSMPIRRVLLSASGSYAWYAQSIDIAKNTLSYNGYLANMDIKAQVLVFMNANHRLSLSLGVGKRWAKNYLEKIELITQRRNLSNIYAGVHYLRSFRQASFDISIGIKQGIKALGAMDNFPTTSNDSKPNFFYTIPTIDTSAYIPFGSENHRFVYTGFVKTQVSRTQLYASEKLSLGGIYSVRGFDSLVLSGEVGVLYRNDFSYYAKSVYGVRFVPSIGLDMGYSLNLYEKPTLDKLLAGGGVGLKLYVSKYFNAEVWGYVPLYNPSKLDKRHFYFSVGSMF